MELELLHFGLAAAAGSAVYAVYFHHGEHHLYPWRYVQAVIVVQLVGTVVLKKSQAHVATSAAVVQAATLMTVFLAGLYGSLLIFRLFLNPLNRFPGPFRARLTAFDISFRTAPKRDLYKYLQAQHRRHGRFVRMGPNALSVSDPDVVRVALAGNSKCSKAPWYAGEHPADSMHSTRSRVEHDNRRRIWSPAFSDKALRGYEKRVQGYNHKLAENIASFSGKPIDMSKWFNLWSFDVMGDLAFGRSFNMLDSATEHWAIKLLNEAQDSIGLAFPDWFGRFLTAIPGISHDYRRFVSYCASMIDDRIAMQGKQTNPDITHYLIEDYNTKDPAAQKAALPKLYSDSKLIIVAGSDTTAATLTYMFYHIALEPGLATRLREELAPLYGANGEIEHQKIQNAPLLNGCINETLRLHPPVPSGLVRKTPREGVQVGDTYVPGDTIMQVHMYTMGRDEDNFAQAEQFIPERFSTRPELVKNKDAFAPFSVGPYGCIGKNLAYIEIRTLTALLLKQFDVALAPGEDGSMLMESRDHFTTGLKPIQMVFTKRN